MTTFDRPHKRQPWAHGSYVEQDTPEHILSCQYTIAACAVGQRQERPEFGWAMPFMRTMPVSFAGLVAALKQFEPRAANVTETQAESVYGEVVQVQSEVATQSVDQ